MTSREQLGAQVIAVASRLRRATRRRLRHTMPTPPLRHAHVELLQVVEAEPGISVRAAARTLHLADNSVSTLVNTLVGAGLIERAVRPDDRRAVRLTLTDAARRRIAQWRAARARLVGAALARLSDDDARTIEAALPALGRLLTLLDEESPLGAAA